MGNEEIFVYSRLQDEGDKNYLEEGERFEIRFKEWLDHKEVAYISIVQSPLSMPVCFQKDTKRPDFLIGLESLGVIAVDVKKYQMMQTQQGFMLDEEKEVKRLFRFQQRMCIPVWLAFSPRGQEDFVCYWIPLNTIKRLFKVKRNRSGIFRCIETRYCIRLSWDDDLQDILFHHPN